MAIDHVNLARIDLNLLVALDALLTERSVTRAAARVGLGQSAMSHNLARLRALFGDELLSARPDGMRPRPRALALVDPVRVALAQIEALVARKTRRSIPARPSGCSGSACRTASRCCSGRRCWPISARRRPASGCGFYSTDRLQLLDELDADRLDLGIGVGAFREGQAHHKRRLIATDTYLCMFNADTGRRCSRRSRSRTMCGCRTCSPACARASAGWSTRRWPSSGLAARSR